MVKNLTGTSDTGKAPAANPTPIPNANPLLEDAQEKIAQVRALAASFPEEADQNALTVRERRLANGTPVQFMERAAQLAEAAPALGASVETDVDLLRDAIYWDLAYSALVDQIYTLGRQVEMAIVSRKLKAAKVARHLYQVARSYVATPAGAPMKAQVQELKDTLRRKRRMSPKPAAAAPAAEDETTKA